MVSITLLFTTGYKICIWNGGFCLFYSKHSEVANLFFFIVQGQNITRGYDIWVFTTFVEEERRMVRIYSNRHRSFIGHSFFQGIFTAKGKFNILWTRGSSIFWVILALPILQKSISQIKKYTSTSFINHQYPKFGFQICFLSSFSLFKCLWCLPLFEERKIRSSKAWQFYVSE